MSFNKLFNIDLSRINGGLSGLAAVVLPLIIMLLLADLLPGFAALVGHGGADHIGPGPPAVTFSFGHAGLSSGHGQITTLPPFQISPTSAEPRASAIARGRDSRACPFALRVILLLKISSFSGKINHLIILKVHFNYIWFVLKRIITARRADLSFLIGSPVGALPGFVRPHSGSSASAGLDQARWSQNRTWRTPIAL